MKQIFRRHILGRKRALNNAPKSSEGELKCVRLRNKIINYISADTCIGTVLSSGKYWEVWMLDYIRRHYKAGTNMIDIGSHIGTTSLLMSEVISHGYKIHAFEPIFHDILNKNVNDNKLSAAISTHPIGLGNKATTYVAETQSLRTSANFGATTIRDCEEDKKRVYSPNTRKIPIRTLDSFNLKNISLIKIDAEHMEIEVLEGALGTIKDCKPTILMETYQYDKFIASDIYAKLVSIGYAMKPIPEGASDYILTIN